MKKLVGSLFFLVTALGATEPDYRAWDALLKKYVHTGTRDGIRTHLINYAALAKDPLWWRAQENFATFAPEKLTSKQEKIAFWINAYNLAAIRKVLEVYPTPSITARGEQVWKEVAISIAGKGYSLDDIEHKILRPAGEARIHFAIVCASLSCPDLLAGAYTARALEKQLDTQTRAFLANPTKGVRLEDNAIYLSAIFTWFAQDFGDISNFLARHGILVKKELPRKELPYNWRLNE